METKTIIYLVAAALILRVIIKLITKYYQDNKTSNPTDSNDE